MSQAALTYGRREWAVELLLLLAQGLLIWMVADLLFAPFTSQDNPLPVWLTVALVVLAGGLPRMLHDTGIWHARFGIVMALAIAFSTLATIKIVSFPGYPWLDAVWIEQAGRSLVFEPSTADIAVWAPIGLSAAVWWLAKFNSSPGLERCRSMLMLATMVTALVAIGSVGITTGPTDRAIALGTIVVFAATLIALAIARQGHEATHSRRRLLTTVLLPTVAIVTIAVALAGLLTFDGIRRSSAALSFLDVVLEPFFQLLVLLLTLLVMLISLPIIWILSLGNYQRMPRINEFTTNGQSDPARSVLDWQPPDPVRFLLAFLVLLAIFYGLTRFGLALTRRDFDPMETGERDYGHGKGFGAWLDRFRGRFGRPIRHDPLSGLRGDPAWAHTVAVRETYADWLRFAETRNLGRSTGETADELDHRAGPNLLAPSATAALDDLTGVYDDVRYASVPATAEQSARARRAWNQLKSAETSSIPSQ
ncbi:MAG: DUF4129 domain-containing protein [Thermomicrobiales bacterium]|nr:MAG: DUF4129 domain-containing protein [Thermomicrobiales bacterium]